MKSYRKLNTIAQLDIINDSDIPKIAELCAALGSETRLKILKLMQTPPYIKTVPQLVRETGIPTTTLLHHLEKMEKAELIYIRYKSSTHGTLRIITRDLKGADLRFYYNENTEKKNSDTEIQTLRVGQFADFSGEDCSFVTKDKHFHMLGTNCFLPERFDAELLYSPNGTATYFFSNNAAKYFKVTELCFEMELCSEAPYYDNNYLSDITFWINGKEIATYTSSGDFGDRRGLLNPSWWSSSNTQYGKLVSLSVTEEGATLNGIVSERKVRLSDLQIEQGNKLVFKFGNKSTALNVGGFNVFGRHFGDYPQDICLKITYET